MKSNKIVSGGTAVTKDSQSLRFSKRQKQKVLYNKFYKIARAVCAVSFVSLAFIALSHLVSALNTVDVSNTSGIPSSWGITSAAQPDKIALTMTYFDQVIDCSGKGTGTRQFDFGQCNDSGGTGLQQGLVKDHLGSDGLPIPAYETTAATKNANVLYQSRGVTGHDPVQPSDNFYRWFHEVPGQSYKYDVETTFTRVGNQNKYTYGGKQIFPLDEGKIEFRDNAQRNYTYNGHNFSFTAHLSVPVRINMAGNELFEFSGDDDVWVFLNGRLVLDIGGTHSAISGNFKINSDGTITSTVNGSNTKTIDAGLTKGAVVTMDFFYAERNITESNTLITITNMEWPIVAGSSLVANVMEDKIQYTSSITNEDTVNGIDIKRLSAFHYNRADEKGGFLPLSKENLEYSYTPNDLTSWQPLDISAPAGSSDGFNLATPLHLAPAGSSERNTVYVRFYVAPDQNDVNYDTTVAYYTTDAYGDTGIAYDTSNVTTDDFHVVPYHYTVTYNANGGTLNNSSPVTYYEDSNIPQPDDPEREGYIFTGWTLSNGNTYDFDQVLTSKSHDFTLTANWIEIPPEPTYHIVVFDSAGGSNTPAQKIEENKTLSHPTDPTRFGYKFLGWTFEGESFDFSTPITEDLTLTATWEQIFYQVSFDLGYDDAPTITTQNIPVGNSVLQPLDPERAGYIFLGWTKTDASEAYDFASRVEENFTLHAHWQIVIVEPDPDPEPEPQPDPEPEPEPETPETPSESDSNAEPEQPDTPSESDTPSEPNPSESSTPSEPDTPAPSTRPTTPGHVVIVRPSDPTPTPDNSDTTPSAPGSTPATSDTPFGPDDTIITLPDDYLGVLGEVVFVPNTGVIEKISTTLFGSQSFTAIVLSQIIVLVNLMVFAVSFAIMFGLRDYADTAKFSPLKKLHALNLIQK